MWPNCLGVLLTRFVLVPGAWLGAWAWKEVTTILENKGNLAYPVTLTGMGERVHLATKDVGMETAIEDVLNVIRYNDIDNLVLVGTASRVKWRLRWLTEFMTRCRRSSTSMHSGQKLCRNLRVGSTRPREFGRPPRGGNAIPLTEEIIDRIGKDVKGSNRKLMMSMATPWPTKLAKDPITLSKNYDPTKEAYVFCSLSGDPVDEIITGKWGKLNGPYKVIETGHWPMITKPEELAKDLMSLAMR